MKKNDVIKELQERAQEQQVIFKGMVFPKLFIFIANYLGENPWKFILFFALCLTIILHFFIGKNYENLILGLFSSL